MEGHLDHVDLETRNPETSTDRSGASVTQGDPRGTGGVGPLSLYVGTGNGPGVTEGLSVQGGVCGTPAPDDQTLISAGVVEEKLRGTGGGPWGLCSRDSGGIPLSGRSGTRGVAPRHPGLDPSGVPRVAPHGWTCLPWEVHLRLFATPDRLRDSLTSDATVSVITSEETKIKNYLTPAGEEARGGVFPLLLLGKRGRHIKSTDHARQKCSVRRRGPLPRTPTSPDRPQSRSGWADPIWADHQGRSHRVRRNDAVSKYL